jgi:hypothetical protein
MGDKLVALEHLEYTVDNVTARVPPGEDVPRDMPKADVDELRSHGAIGTDTEFANRKVAAAQEANRDRIRREAEAAGLKVTG